MHDLKKLAIAVTFFYRQPRLAYLDTISATFKNLAPSVHAYILTNTLDGGEKAAIRAVLQEKGVPFSIHSPKLLGHPYLLTWCHFAIFRELLEKDEAVTHFLYLEDDILITESNIEYWLQGRRDLQAHGLIPSFLRYETKEGDNSFYMTDFTRQVAFDSAPKIHMGPDYCYMNMPFPYQGMYLLDRDLMTEHMRGKSSSPDSRHWGIRESAAQGLTFANVPAGFTARNLAGFNTRKFAVDPRCLIHHTANTYAADPGTVLAKTPCHDLII